VVEQLAVAPLVILNIVKKRKTDKRRYKDRREYIIKAVDKRRKLLKKKAVDYKGGRCISCGYDRCIQALEFHHVDLAKKDFGVSAKGYTRSWKKVQQELDRCILVCANCHREIHAGIRQLSRESGIEKRGELSD